MYVFSIMSCIQYLVSTVLGPVQGAIMAPKYPLCGYQYKAVRNEHEEHVFVHKVVSFSFSLC